MRIPLIYNLRSLIQRRTTTVAAAGGIALVVATFVGMLAMAAGFRHALVTTGREDNVVVLRAGADTEATSAITRPDAAIIESLPQVAHDAQGRPLASAEVVTMVAMKREDGSQANVPVRGVNPDTALELRPSVHLIAGRMLRPGRSEAIVGRGLVGHIRGVRIGDRIHLGKHIWTVVGEFASGGSAFESEIWGDASSAMDDLRGPVFQAVTFRLADPYGFAAAKAALKGDPRLQVEALRERAYFASQSKALGNVLRFLAWFVTSIMAVGAIFGAINTMDALVSHRTREIALLLTLGFPPRSVLGSFLLEALLIALAGGVVGCLLALPLNGLSASTTNWSSFAEITFAMRVTPTIVAQALGFAAVMGIVGGLLPARTAARQSLVASLRA